MGWEPIVLRGEIRLVDLGKRIPGEQAKVRPAVVVSNDGANAAAARSGSGVATVAPLTTNVRRVYPFQVRVSAEESGLDRESKVQAEQVRAVSVHRVRSRVGVVPPIRMLEVDEALQLHLAL